MKLKIEFIDENTGQKIVVKNKGTKVMYYNSDDTDVFEYKELTDMSCKLDKHEKDIFDTFYKLAGSLS
jgi:hypothetical protein